MNKKSFFLLLGTFTALLIFRGQFVYATTGLSITPIKLSHVMDAGETVFGVIELTNVSDSSVGIDKEAQDFVPIAGQNSLQFVGRTNGLTTVADWITIDLPAKFTIKPGQKVVVPYSIKAPVDAEPGSHLGVIFFRAIPPEGGNLAISTKVGSLVLVTIRGPFTLQGKVLSFLGPGFVQTPPVTFTMKFQNTGTVHFEPQGTIKIRNMWGQEVDTVGISGQTVLPSGVRDLSYDWTPKGTLFGRYRADIVITDPYNNGAVIAASSLSFWAFPVKKALIFLGVVVLVFLILWYIKRHLNIVITLKK